MIWDNLKLMKCPRCSQLIDDSGKRKGSEKHYVCTSCHFGIWENKLKSITHKPAREKYHVPTEEDNLAALNNLGHDEVAEDFSDSFALDL